jgi:2,4-dienoyl-CoA reductase-like NADH-dependent reductase (Old Yellow Enzyme family)
MANDPSPPKGASSALFTPLKIANGNLELKHRIVLTPCTRNRGVPLSEGTPDCPNRIWAADALVAEYYAQRASEGGLLVSEGITPSPEGGAMPGVPGMWLEEQAEGWRLVFQTRMMIQLWKIC